MITNKTTVFESKTTDYTSPGIPVADAESIAVQFKRASHSSGNTVFKLQGTLVDSPGSSDWIDLMLVKNVANTNAQTLTRVTSVTLSSNTSELYFVDPNIAQALRHVRIDADVTTDGSNSAYLFAKRRVGRN